MTRKCSLAKGMFSTKISLAAHPTPVKIFSGYPRLVHLIEPRLYFKQIWINNSTMSSYFSSNLFSSDNKLD